MPGVISRRLAVLLLTFTACTKSPESEAPPKRAATPTTISPTVLAAQAGGFVSAVDERGIPSFVWASASLRAAPGDTPELAARGYLGRFAKAHAIAPRDVEKAELKSVHQLDRIGVIAKLSQRAHGIEIYPSEVRVLMRSNLELVAISGSLRPAAITTKRTDFRLTGADALANAITDAMGVAVRKEAVVERSEAQGDFVRFDLDPGHPVTMPMPARAKRIFFARGDELEPAYFVEFYAGFGDDVDALAYRYLISANDGRVLDRRDLTHSDPFTYRVYADTTGNHRPMAGPHEDYAPHPTGMPDGSTPMLIPAPLITIEGFNTNPLGRADPWLASSARETRGNNVDAYADDNAPDGFSNGDTRATLTGPRTFDRVYDTTIDPAANETQTMASVAEIFYVTNWLHDYWYDSGFDEAAGNAQLNNFGRGGVGGDPLRAEAQDSHALGRRNNANMSTPSDGMSPRMQMYAWTGAQVRTLTVSSSPTPLTNAGANFGPRNFDITGPVVLADDGSGTPTDGCQPIVNNVAGSIALIDRGACAFVTKALNAQAAGAIGMILANNRGGNPPTMGGTSTQVTIGLLSITQADGNAVKAALMAGPVTATLFRSVSADRDGSYDHGVVTHEWGHYIHNRLTDCGSLQCRGIGEGWGDFLALHTELREGDNLDGVYARSIWARLSLTDGAYFGGRRVPYSTNPAANEMRFRHIADGETLPTHPIQPRNPNSEVHNSGEVWASMMFEAYVDLLRPTVGSTSGPSFDDVRRTMTDYIVAGMMMTPRDSTFTEARDGILAAAAARSPADLATLAAAFARRGLGSCAVSPDRYASGNAGPVESYEVKGKSSIRRIAFADDLRSCDDDGVLDAQERGVLSVEIDNGGVAALTNTTVTVTSTIPGVTFPNGNTATPASIDGLSSVSVDFEIAVDDTLTASTALTLVVRVEDSEACETTITSTVISRINFDETAGSRTDDVEPSSTAWTITGDRGADVWAREEIEPLSHAWHGLDFGSPSDTALETPPLTVGTTGPLVVTFMHRYRFEADDPDGSNTNWDGGVIEISRDGGMTWSDTSSIADPGYRGTLTDTSGNPLANRPALVGTSTAWPDRQRVWLDYADAFAGEQIQLRFRIGTDAAVGDYGWEIDDLEFIGIDNAPFFAIGADTSVCPEPLVAIAGPDQMVGPEEVVFLDGTASTSETNLPLSYAWTQSAGPAVTLVDNGEGRVLFVAPQLTAEATLEFTLTVDDGNLTDTDTVDVVVAPTDGPIADAGPDQSAATGDVVALDGTGSTGSAPITFAWAQTAPAEPVIALVSGDGPTPSFTAPVVDEDTTFTFELSVSDGARTDTDTVDISIGAAAPVVANAGEDQTVDAGTSVVLDGTASTGPAGRPLTYEWTQTSGPTIVIGRADTFAAVFTAPRGPRPVAFEFQLTVSDGTRSATDTVSVNVNAEVKQPTPTNPPVEEGGCSCTSSHRGSAPVPWGLFLVVLVVAGRRCRRSRRR